MAKVGTVIIDVRIESEAAVRRLIKAAHLAEELAEDQPWNSNAKRIADLIRDGLKGVKVEARHGK